MEGGITDPNLTGMGGMNTPGTSGGGGGDGSGGLSGNMADSPPDDGMGPPDGLGGHQPKRRRVTRACDECRRKKIKCDGKQPCTHCAVYSYTCSYDQPSQRRRNPQPQYMEALERQVKALTTVLKANCPQIDVSEITSSQDVNSLREAVRQNQARGSTSEERDDISGENDGQPATSSNITNRRDDNMLESMVQDSTHMKIDRQGSIDYRGSSSSFHFVRSMYGNLSKLLGSGPNEMAGDTAQLSLDDIPFPELQLDDLFLPPRPIARKLYDYMFDHSMVFVHFFHRPTFIKHFKMVYDYHFEQNGPGNQGDRTQQNIKPADFARFLPLLYASFAVGCVYAADDAADIGIPDVHEAAYKYYAIAKKLLKPLDDPDLYTVQTLILMVIYLMCSYKMSLCYTHLGAALRAAQRLGLHRKLDYKFTPIELEERKRTFWAAYNIERYLNCVLGLPASLRDDDIDQDMPAEIDDEFVTEWNILSQPAGQPSITVGCNVYTRLMGIISKITKYIYPLKAPLVDGKGLIRLDQVKEIEQDLERWRSSIPDHLVQPAKDSRFFKYHYSSSQGAYDRQAGWLRMSYYSLQLLLYRSFIHYATPVSVRAKRGANGELSKSGKTGLTPHNQKYYNYAAKCLNAARATLRTADNMHKGTGIRSAYWFTMYSMFNATIILLFCVIQNPSDPANDALIQDAEYGRKMIQELTGRSLTATRCCALINELFTVMHRVKAKVEAEKDKKQLNPSHKRSATDEKSLNRPQQRRRSSQQRGGSGTAAIPTSPTAISPRTTNPSVPILGNSNSGVTGSPTNTFTPGGVNGTNRSFTPQSQTGSSPSSEMVFPFAMGTQQGIYTPFGNSPPLFPVAGQTQQGQLPAEILDMGRDDDGSSHLWRSLFGPPGSSLPPTSFSQGFSQPVVTSTQQGNTSPGRATGEFRDPNDINMDMGEESSGVNLGDIDAGLVDWSDFIAQCSQVWVTE